MPRVASPATRGYLTPPQYAKQIGVDPEKVLRWIENGELKAFDAATRRGGRPRWRIPPQAVVDFERNRAAQPAPKSRRRRRLQPIGEVWFP